MNAGVEPGQGKWDMKPSMWGLLIAAGAFGASTIYLSAQLKDERARADEVLEQSRALNARIAELERAREQLALMTMAPGDTLTVEPASSDARSSPAAGKPPNAEPADASVLAADVPRRPERSEAMRKVMRAQVRANLKRLHGDIGEKLGLGPDDTRRLIDLLADQQMAQFARGRSERRDELTPEQRTAAWNEQRERNLAEVTALIGSDKVDAYRSYLQTLPARQEVDALSRQLDAVDIGLGKDQRDRLVMALVEERQRVPAPTLAGSVSREDYARDMAAWQEDYNRRATARASGILSTEQQSAYAEYQQWTTEMRQQFDARRAARAGTTNTSQTREPRQP